MASLQIFRFSSFFRFIFCFTLFVGHLLIACQPKGETRNDYASSISSTKQDHYSIKHAIGFDIEYFEKYKILHLFRHYNEAVDTISYVLKTPSASISRKHQHWLTVDVPLNRIALLHSSYLSFFELCDSFQRIKAISEAKYIYNTEVYNLIESGALPEIGYGETLDKEHLLALNVDAVVTVGWPNAPNKSQQLLEELGIPVLILSDWQESTLMGRFEWVKVIAALTDKDEMIHEKFEKVDARYDSLKQLAKGMQSKPSVICNLPYKGSWYMPGGNSYVSNVIRDAGGNYLWSDDDGTGGIQIDFEAVYAKGVEADFWINPGFENATKDILGKDERLKDLKPILDGKVFNSNNRIARGIANDYWESGIIHPDLILADLIRIFHPGILPGHQSYYYKRIQ